MYQRLLTGGPVSSRQVEVAGGRVHLLEHGAGPPVVVLHGAGNPAGFMLPLLRELHGVRVIAPDRPGVGLSDPIDLPQDRYREAAVAWLDRLLDTLELDTTTLLGHSGVQCGRCGTRWPTRTGPSGSCCSVRPGAEDPLPAAAPACHHPGGRPAAVTLVPPSPKSILRFAHHVAGEKETLARHPDLVDLLVAAGRDPITDHVSKAELRFFVSPFGFRRRSRVRLDELRHLTMPTMLIWGEYEPLGGVAVAQSVTDLIPHARLEVLPTGHGPWLGQPTRTAATVLEFVQ